MPWQGNMKPEPVSELTTSTLTFQTQFVQQGHSGGGLFNENWELVGMVKQDQPPRCGGNPHRVGDRPAESVELHRRPQPGAGGFAPDDADHHAVISAPGGDIACLADGLCATHRRVRASPKCGACTTAMPGAIRSRC